LPTLKATQPTSKSKGYAFLEFTEKKGLQAALKLHHSELEGRKINVELTAGGGGKSEGRLNKVKERNKALHEQRVCFACRITQSHIVDMIPVAETTNREGQNARSYG
jgi:RNA recognition motif-containing protein